MENRQRDVILILGKTGSGKTTFARHLVRPLPRVFIVDADFREFGALSFDTFPDLTAYLEKKSPPGNFFRVSYTPYTNEYPLVFDLSRLVAPVHLVLEEADRFDDPRYCLEYEEVIARGRHSGVSIIALSRYPYALPSMLRREATRIIAFHHHEPSDLNWFSDVMGPDTEMLPDLREHEFLDWRPGQNIPLNKQKLSLTEKGGHAIIEVQEKEQPLSGSDKGFSIREEEKK